MTQKLKQDAIQVYDADNDKLVTVTEKMQKDAWEAHGQLMGGFMQVAEAIHRIRDGKLYVAMGFASFATYANSVNIGTRTAHRYGAFGAKMEAANVPLGAQTEAFSEIGKSKMFELSRLAADQLSHLLAGDSILSESGESIDLETIKSMKKDDVAKLVTSFKTGKKPDKKSEIAIKEENALLKEQLKLADAEKKSLQKRIEDAEIIEKQYGPVATAIADKRKRLDEAREGLIKMVSAMNHSGVTIDDPIDVQHAWVDVYQTMQVYMDKLLDHHRPLLEIVGDAVTTRLP